MGKGKYYDMAMSTIPMLRYGMGTCG